MRIGIIGTEYAIRSIKESISPEGIYAELEEFPCEAENVCQVLEQKQSELDGVFFTGYLFFSYACQGLETTIPWSYAKRSEHSATKALLEAAMKGTDIRHVTFDLMENTVEQLERIILSDTDISRENIRLFRYIDSNYYTRTQEDYVKHALDFHRRNLSLGKATLCLSGMHEIVKTLRQEGYCAEWVRPTVDELNRQINELSLRFQIRKHHEAAGNAFAVIALQVEVGESYYTGSQLYMKLNGLHQTETCIYNFAHMLGAAVEKNTDGRFMIYTTKEELGILTQGFSSLSIMEDIKPIVSISRVYAGMGISKTHAMAKSNAEVALKRARQGEDSCYYIKEDDESVSGPFWAESSRLDASANDAMLAHISDETGVGIPIIKTLIEVQNQYRFESITSAELAALCHMTISNTNRILSKLEMKKYALTVGYKSTHRAGRPRRIIKLCLTAEP